MADAIYKEILDSAKAVIIADGTLGATFTASNTFVVKRLAGLRELKTTVPFMLIGPFGSKRILGGTNVQTDISYPVAFVTVADGSGLLTANINAKLQWHETIIGLFHDKRLSGVTEVQRGFSDPRDVFDPSAWLSGYDAGGVMIRFQTRETRP